MPDVPLSLPDIEDLLAELLEKNRERAAKKRERDAKRRERGRRIVREWLRSCVDCGCTDTRILECDHVWGWNFTISENLWRSVRELEAELKLCQSRCRNCHAIRHAEERERLREMAIDELL